MKVLVIYNPVAGLNKINELKTINSFLTDNNFDYSLVQTTIENGPYEILSNLESNYKTIITCGGDGTVSETIRGMHNFSQRGNLLILPIGTSNEIAKNLGLQDEKLKKTLNRLFEYNISTLDYGLINDINTFTYALTFGNFTEVTYKTPQKMKNWLGFRAYLLYGFLTFRKIRTYKLEIKTKKLNISGNYLFGAISNSESIGNIVHYDKKSISLCDGKFEVLLISKPNNVNELRLILTGLIKNDYSDKIFTTFNADKITINSKVKINWNTDGEYAGSYNNIFVKNLHKKINLIV